VRKRERHARQTLRENVGDPQFVDRIDDRPEQADADCFGLRRDEPVEHGRERLFVEGFDDPPIAPDPLRHLERQRPWHIGVREGFRIVEQIGPATFPKEQDVRVAFGREKRRPGCGAGKNGIERPRGRVHEHRSAAKQGLARPTETGCCEIEGVEHASHGVIGRGRGLEGVEGAVVLHNEVAEGAAHIDRKPHCASPVRDTEALTGPLRRVNSDDTLIHGYKISEPHIL
jgi:hypothetical protein